MIKKISSINPLQPTQKVIRGRSRGESFSGNSGDNLEVSSFAKELSLAMGELRKVPEIRSEKVESLRQQVEAGTYQPKLSLVALNLLGAVQGSPGEGE
ncbi:MAG TPA: flagellar biosynthesis anti-sigma factor FlgM [Synergistaceae bacterium]|nr:flagellar biosynthesis anti-sigma factor FlgM [Synergistaceae bacterium]